MIYVVGNTLLHRLHPLTKLALAVLLLVVVNLSDWPWFSMAVVGVLLLAATSAGVAGRLVSITVRLLLPLFFSLFLIQGVLFPPPDATTLFALGPVRLTSEGLLFAFVTASRLLALTTTLLLMLLVTHPADLVSGLSQLGLPRSIGYVLIVTLQIAPDVGKRAGAIIEAQQSRGLEVGGGIRRLRALPSLVGPLVVGALGDVEERAMAIESRAFLSRGPKTSLRQLHDTTAQRLLRWLVLAAIIGLVVVRFAGWPAG